MRQHAATKTGSQQSPGGRRVGKAEIQRRLDLADGMLRDGRSRAEVIRALRSQHGVSLRTADQYIRRARERWAAESKEGRTAEREVTLARLTHLSSKAEQRGAFAAAVAAERLRADVLGLRAPEQLQVQASVAEQRTEAPVSYEQALAEMAECLPILARAVRKGALVTSVLARGAAELSDAIATVELSPRAHGRAPDTGSLAS
jgi:hypothetical protein